MGIALSQCGVHQVSGTSHVIMITILWQIPYVAPSWVTQLVPQNHLQVPEEHQKLFSSEASDDPPTPRVPSVDGFRQLVPWVGSCGGAELWLLLKYLALFILLVSACNNGNNGSNGMGVSSTMVMR